MKLQNSCTKSVYMENATNSFDILVAKTDISHANMYICVGKMYLRLYIIYINNHFDDCVQSRGYT